MAERATPKGGRGGPARAASPVDSYLLPARVARTLAGPAANDNPEPRGPRWRRRLVRIGYGGLLAALALFAVISLIDL